MRPVGRRPGWVYWARRAIVVLIAVAVVAGVWSLVASLTSGPSAGPPPASPSLATPSSSTSTPATIADCGPQNTALDLSGYRQVKQSGTQTLTLAITNSSDQDCSLKLSGANAEVTITSGKDRIWSTADCAKWMPTARKTLAAGESSEVVVKWGLRRSSAVCKTNKTPAGVGTYVATAKFAETMSERQVFTVVK